MQHSRSTILLTRPAQQSAAYRDILRKQLGTDFSVLISPLLEITPTAAPLDLRDVHTILFTSANGVNAFAARSDQRDIACLCVGGRTAARARKLGFQALSGQGNIQDLTALALARSPLATGVFLHVRGQHAAGDLVADLSAAGRPAREVILYEQTSVPLENKALAAISSGTQILLPLFSPRTAQIFMSQTETLDLGHVSAICISPSVAERLEPTRFARLSIADHPDAASVTKKLAAII